MSACDDLIDEYGRATTAPLGTLSELQQKLAEIRIENRTEVLAEVTAWLVKKAREFHVSSRKREREQGDTCAVLASKIARGAVRPDNLRMLPEPGFFEVDRTYERGYWRFQCLAIAPMRWSGETRAVGFLSRRDGTEVVHSLGPDNWEDDGWNDITPAGDAA